MSEHLRHISPENHSEPYVNAEAPRQVEHHLADQQTEYLQKAGTEARRAIHEIALAKEQYTRPVETEALQHHYVTRRMRQDAFAKTMRDTQHELPKYQRNASKFIHNATIENVSDSLAKTVARPSGVIGGATTAIGIGLFVAIIARTIGFEIPNSLLPILFVGGFGIGITVELISNRFRKRARQR